MKTWRFASWGLGIQSTWMIILSAIGKLPPIDAAIVADTQWERKKTQGTLQFYRRWFEDRDIKVKVVTAGNIRELGAVAHIHIPFWTSDGGPLQRQCTSHFKITPIKREMRRIAGFHESKPPHPKPGQFKNWVGFSWDEWDRMKRNRIKFILNEYPLIEKKINRWDCEEGYLRMRLPVPVKSACIGCPYRDAASWLDLKQNNPEEFQDAVRFDEENRRNPLAERDNSTADELYVWRGCLPLRDIDFEKESKRQKKNTQIPLFVCKGEVCWT